MLSPELIEELLRFRQERDWEQFHTARTLSSALAVETAELLEIFQWVPDSDLEGTIRARREDIEREIADVLILLSYLCHDLGIAPDECVRAKLVENAGKYPVSKARGTAKKYDRL